MEPLPGIVYTSVAAVQPNWVKNVVVDAAGTDSQTDRPMAWRRAEQYQPPVICGVGNKKQIRTGLCVLFVCFVCVEPSDLIQMNEWIK